MTAGAEGLRTLALASTSSKRFSVQAKNTSPGIAARNRATDNDGFARRLFVAALAIARDPQTRSGTSLEKIVQALRPLRHVTIRISDQHLEAEPDIPDHVAELLTSLGH